LLLLPLSSFTHQLSHHLAVASATKLLPHTHHSSPPSTHLRQLTSGNYLAVAAMFLPRRSIFALIIYNVH
jgi:hypothetical protein